MIVRGLSDDDGRTLGLLLDQLDAKENRNKLRAALYDGKSPAAALVDELKRRRVRGVTVTDHNDMADACAWFYQAVMERTMRHTGQPQLDAALAGASKRTLGDRWAWNRKTAAADITPLVAATLALWGVQTSKVKGRTPEDRNRRVVILQ